MKDPYQALGVARTASADEIKRAYRKLAKQLHPDLNPDRPDVARRFQEVTDAYDVLTDPERRAAYDRGEREGAAGFAGAGGFGTHGRTGFGDDGFQFRRGGVPPDGDDLFEQIFGMFGQGARRSGWQRRGPQDDARQERGGQERGGRPEPVRVSLDVPFLVAVKGGTQRVQLPSGREIDLRIPAGTETGTQLRLPHQGRSGRGGEAGDVIVTVAVEDHPVFRRDGNDILAELAVDLHQAVLGDRVTVPTIDGPVTMRVPPGSNTGARLRLRGKGVPARRNVEAGDQYVTLRIVLANPKDPALNRFLRERQAQSAKAD
ncbi:MAG: J domain-containing protein [Alphaproteobacteria bacterium]|nr:J domain-containing protein [Alphaproteobacteria bacterium]MCB9928019.1 J domain-containing protein [Alphaproteobacteria bacterium]